VRTTDGVLTTFSFLLRFVGEEGGGLKSVQEVRQPQNSLLVITYWTVSSSDTITLVILDLAGLVTALEGNTLSMAASTVLFLGGMARRN